MLNGLDLFSGIGGISLALRPWARTVCYVESEPYCQQVLRERIAEGQLDDAPIWDDVRTFDPRPWRGLVDIVAGGFPCQDISTAGRGAGLAGERSGLFTEIIRIAGDLRPRFIFLENVAAICADGRGGWDVVGALAALGYDARWGVLSAFDVGAPHLRERWWCLAHADARRKLQPQGGKSDQRRWTGHSRPVPHTPALLRGTIERGEPGGVLRGAPALAPAPGGGFGTDGRTPRGYAAIGGVGWWAVEPGVGRVADGVPARVDRLRGLGNAVVPACAREAFRRLLTGEGVT